MGGRTWRLGLVGFIWLVLAALSPVCFSQGQREVQGEIDPETVLLRQGEFQLRYKHVLAYIAGELEGEDPAMAQDPAVVEELTRECLEEFAEAPEEVLEDLEQQYEFLLFEQQNPDRATGLDPENSAVDATPSDPSALPSGSDVDQWRRTLSGAALRYSYQESYSGGTAQGTQVLHLCPDGSFFIVGFSAVSGSFSSGSVLDKSQGELMEQGTWAVLSVQGVTAIQLTEKGVPYRVAISVVEGKVLLQGIALMEYFPNSAQCR